MPFRSGEEAEEIRSRPDVLGLRGHIAFGRLQAVESNEIRIAQGRAQELVVRLLIHPGGNEGIE